MMSSENNYSQPHDFLHDPRPFSLPQPKIEKIGRQVKLQVPKLKGQNHDQSEKKSIKKPQFNNRMKRMAADDPLLSSTYQEEMRSGLRRQNSDKQTSRQRNNKAAKTSRERKKIYIRALQEASVNLQSQIFAVEEEIESLHSQIFNALMHTEQVNKKNAQLQNHIIRKLKNLVRQGDLDHKQRAFQGHLRDAQLNIYLDSCIYRIGASGSERIAILDILYKGFINRNIPNIYRYILWCAVNDRHIFSEIPQKAQDWISEIKELDPYIRKNQEYLQQNHQRVAEKGKQIYACVRQILAKKRQIENYGYSYEQLIKKLRQIMTPSQFAQLFLFVQRTVHKKEMQFLSEKQSDYHQRCQKKVKLQDSNLQQNSLKQQ